MNEPCHEKIWLWGSPDLTQIAIEDNSGLEG